MSDEHHALVTDALEWAKTEGVDTDVTYRVTTVLHSPDREPEINHHRFGPAELEQYLTDYNMLAEIVVKIEPEVSDR